MHSGSAVTSATKIIKAVATSSTHAEIHALFHAVKDLMYLRRLSEELGFAQNTPSIIYEDNAACIKFAESLRVKPRTKHVEIKYLYIKQLVSWGQVVMVKVGTDNQLADYLTKVLDKTKHSRFSSAALGYKSTQELGIITAQFSKGEHIYFMQLL